MATAYTCRSPIVTWRHYYDFKHTLMNRRIAAAFHQNGSCSRCCKKQPGHVTTSHRFSLLARWFTSYRPSTVCQRRYMTPLTTRLVACMSQIVRLLIETHSTGRRHSAVFALGNFTPRHSEITGIIIVIILRPIRVHSCVVCMQKSTRYAPADYTIERSLYQVRAWHSLNFRTLMLRSMHCMNMFANSQASRSRV